MTATQAHLVGFRCYPIDEDAHLNLYLGFFTEEGLVETETFYPIKVWSAPAKPENYPMRARAKMILDAMCRFYDCGGNVNECLDLARLTGRYVRDRVMECPDHNLVAITEDVIHSIIYQDKNDSDRFIRIVPDEFTENLSGLSVYKLAMEEGFIDDVYPEGAACPAK